jgi:hypothetical protein
MPPRAFFPWGTRRCMPKTVFTGGETLPRCVWAPRSQTRALRPGGARLRTRNRARPPCPRRPEHRLAVGSALPALGIEREGEGERERESPPACHHSSAAPGCTPAPAPAPPVNGGRNTGWPLASRTMTGSSDERMISRRSTNRMSASPIVISLSFLRMSSRSWILTSAFCRRNCDSASFVMTCGCERVWKGV